MLRIFAIIAPSMAASTSASPNTRNGALPPSSMLTRCSWPALCRTSTLPTSVEPVKLTFRSRGSAISASLTAPELWRRDDVEHAVRQARLREQVGEQQHGERGLAGGLDDHRAAGRDGRPDLAGAHREREVPRGDEQARPDRLLEGQQPAATGRCLHPPAVDPHRLLGEPAEELAAVRHLAAGLGHGLAHLQAHQPGEVVGPRGDQVEGPAQDLAALARRGLRPLRLRGHGRLQRGLRIVDRAVRDIGEDRPVGGVDHVEAVTSRRRAPLAPDEELTAVQGQRFVAHEATVAPQRNLRPVGPADQGKSSPETCIGGHRPVIVSESFRREHLRLDRAPALTPCDQGPAAFFGPSVSLTVLAARTSQARPAGVDPCSFAAVRHAAGRAVDAVCGPAPSAVHRHPRWSRRSLWRPSRDLRQPAVRRNASRIGPAVREPDSPTSTNTATARSPCAATIQAWVCTARRPRRTRRCRSSR